MRAGNYLSTLLTSGGAIGIAIASSVAATNTKALLIKSTSGEPRPALAGAN